LEVFQVITNTASGTNIVEIASGIYRINTPVVFEDGAGFSFNQYVIADNQPLLYHTGPRKMFELVRQAVAAVIPPETLRYVGFSHVEADECGSLNDWLALAPDAVPVCSAVAAMVSVNDLSDRQARPMADGERLDLGSHCVRWLDTPHLPHAWECGHLFEECTATLFCGDLFTQGGSGQEPLIEHDILSDSEAFRHQMDYFSHSVNAGELLERLAGCEPRILACMHGSAWKGDGGGLLRALAKTLTAS
jgi:flavorubredoxin